MLHCPCVSGCLFFLSKLPITAKDWYLFASFRGNGGMNIYLADWVKGPTASELLLQTAAV